MISLTDVVPPSPGSFAPGGGPTAPHVLVTPHFHASLPFTPTWRCDSGARCYPILSQVLALPGGSMSGRCEGDTWIFKLLGAHGCGGGGCLASISHWGSNQGGLQASPHLRLATTGGWNKPVLCCQSPGPQPVTGSPGPRHWVFTVGQAVKTQDPRWQRGDCESGFHLRGLCDKA